MGLHLRHGPTIEADAQPAETARSPPGWVDFRALRSMEGGSLFDERTSRLELLRDWVEVVPRAHRSAEVAVAHHPHSPEKPVAPHQPDERVNRRSRRRARLEVAIEGDADAAGVTALDVGADRLQGATPVDPATREDDEVVTNVDPALRLVLALNRPETGRLLLLRRPPPQGRVDGVMDDDLEGPLRDPAAGRGGRSPLLPWNDPALRYGASLSI
jgi:hypothetical protein